MAPFSTAVVVGVSAISACLAPIAAAPTPQPFWLPKGDLVPNTFSDASVLSTVTLTLSNGTSTLPGPAGLTLKTFAIGVGTQNYTCDPTNATAAPVAVGAVASLINAADILPYLPSGQGQNILDLLPSFLYQVGRATVDASVLPQTGKHYFSAPKTPTFDLTPAGLGIFYGMTAGDIVAPANATTGPHGAVDWLALTQHNGSSPTNAAVKMVYRLFTASGKPAATCGGQPAEIQVPYSAQYMFFG